jgi:hypothetical protein
MSVASSSKWLNIIAIIQDDNGEKRELISTVFTVNTFITSVS